MSNLTVKILEVSGLTIAAQYVGLPVGRVRSMDEVVRSFGNLDRGSVSRLSRLIAKGDEHAKIMRQVVVHMEITGPIYWWTQFATYEIGREMYSGSTMHTLMRGVEGKNFTHEVMDEAQRIVEYFTTDESQRDLIYAKANLPGGYLQTRLIMINYQTLRRMWLQRRTHKLPEWSSFIQVMHELPHCDDLIFVEPKNPWRELWRSLSDDVGILNDAKPDTLSIVGLTAGQCDEYTSKVLELLHKEGK
jgi:hypothetical protein